MLAALDDVVAHFGEATPAEVSVRTRGEEWQAASAGRPITAADLARTLPNAHAVLEHLANPHP